MGTTGVMSILKIDVLWECLGANVCQEREVPGDKQVAGS